jgi:type VI secretion system secreted protein Hcp
MQPKFSSFHRGVAVLLTALGLTAIAPAALAQTLQVFMKADGIPGESVDADHRSEIQLTGYSQTFGTRNCSRVVANKSIDRASPLLISRAAANQLIPTVVISMRKAGDAPKDFFKATLNLVLVERIELVEENGQLVEHVVMAPRNITIEYRPQDDKGALGAPVVSNISCG